MKRATLLFLLFIGTHYGPDALAQDASAWIGPSDCRLAPLKPPPQRAPGWEGACKNGFAEGKGELSWRDARAERYRLEATLVAGRPSGSVKLWLPNGSVYTGPVKDGVPDGQGYFRDPDNFQYEGEVRMGERSGIAEAVYPDGNHYKGSWKNGKREGQGVLTYVLGGRYEGGWKDDKPSGAGRIFYAGSPVREEAVIDGVLPGKPAVPATGTRYALQGPRENNGRLFRQAIVTNLRIPPTLGYQELSEDQQAFVRSRYPALAPGDEPPYPMNGPGAFFDLVRRIIGATQQEGQVEVYVLVDKDGKVAGVTSVGLKNAEVGKAVGLAAARLKYKPAICAGEPCQMIYPYSVRMVIDD